MWLSASRSVITGFLQAYVFHVHRVYVGVSAPVRRDKGIPYDFPQEREIGQET